MTRAWATTRRRYLGGLVLLLAIALFSPIAIEGIPTITVGTSSSEYTPGSVVNISGSISPGAEGKHVGIEVKSPSKRVWIDIVDTVAGGSFASSFKLASDAEMGTYTVYASFEDGTAWSTFKVVPPPPPPPPPPPSSEVSIGLSNSVVSPGESVTISGSVGPPRQITVTIEVSVDGGSWTTLAQVLSSSGGYYSYNWAPPGAEMTYHLRASIPASGTYAAATSGVVSLLVTMLPGAPTSKTTNVTLPSGASCSVGVASNSSDVKLSLDLEARRININVTGPAGTIGTLRIFIPNELLLEYHCDVNDLVFVMDGKEIVPDQIITVPNGYIIVLTYTHSTHTIYIYMETYELTLKVTDFQGRPISSVTVNLTGPVSRSGITNASGIVTFSRLLKGRYTIVASEISEAGRKVVDVTGSGRVDIQTTIGAPSTEYLELQQAYNGLQANFQGLQSQYQQLQTNYQGLQANYSQLQTGYQQLQTELESTKALLTTYGVAGVGLVVVVVILGALWLRSRKPK